MSVTNRLAAFLLRICYVCSALTTLATDGNGVLGGAKNALQTAPATVTAPNPILSYSTYLGGSSDDAAFAVTTDSSGNTYVAGYTTSTDFPATAGAYKTTQQGGSYDAFVSKFSPNGTLIYATYLGGSGNDIAYGIAVDSAGNAYVTGYTSSTDFPTTSGAYRTTYAGGASDTFVVKLNPAGNALVYSTYLGGSGDDTAYAIALDSANEATITGSTNSLDFPTSNGAFQASYGGGLTNAFVTRLNAAGTALAYSSYLGGSGEDVGYGVAVDSQGVAYVTGYTASANFPTKSGAVQVANAGSYDAFVTAVNATGTGQVYSTFLGGSSDDYGVGIAVDSTGNAFVTGYTASTNFPTSVGALQTTNHGGYDAFVAKLNPTGSVLTYSTYLGGTGDDFSQAIAVDSSGNAYLTGETSSDDLPLTGNAFQTAIAGTDSAMFAKLNSTGTGLIYSSYLGGSGFDAGYGVAVTANRAAWVAGYTVSSDFPTTSGAANQTLAGGSDAFLSQISPPVATLTAASTTGLPGSPVNVPLALTLESGVTLSNLSFTLSITPNSSAPALTGTLAFVKDAALPNPTSVDTSGGPGSITVTWQNLNPPLSATTISLGQVTVNIPASATGAQTYTASITAITGSSSNLSYALAPGPNVLVTLALPYLVGDVFPASGTSSGQFGDGVINTLDLLATLRAATNIPGALPASCTDLFDALDSFPTDGSSRGGDGAINTLDLLSTLRRVTNVDTSRPTRLPRGQPCSTVQPDQTTRPVGSSTYLSFAMTGQGLGVYLTSEKNLSLSGISFALEAGEFAPVEGLAPTLLDTGLPGKIAVAWLNGLELRGGKPLLLGYLPGLTNRPEVYGISGVTKAEGSLLRISARNMSQ